MFYAVAVLNVGMLIISFFYFYFLQGGGGGKARFVWGHIKEFSTAFHYENNLITSGNVYAAMKEPKDTANP